MSRSGADVSLFAPRIQLACHLLRPVTHSAHQEVLRWVVVNDRVLVHVLGARSVSPSSHEGKPCSILIVSWADPSRRGENHPRLRARMVARGRPVTQGKAGPDTRVVSNMHFSPDAKETRSMPPTRGTASVVRGLAAGTPVQHMPSCSYIAAPASHRSYRRVLLARPCSMRLVAVLRILKEHVYFGSSEPTELEHATPPECPHLLIAMLHPKQ